MAGVSDALKLAKRGVPVFPLKPDKTPHTPRGFHDATSAPDAVALLWERHPDAMVGVPTGEVSGLFVLDIDRKNGVDGSESLKSKGRGVPLTRTHATKSGGSHYLFRYPQGVRLKSTAGKLGPGVDTRGEGGYIVWWPAEGLDVPCNEALADVPEWLTAALAVSSTKRTDSAGESIPIGQRNASLTRMAGVMRRHGATSGDIETALSSANARCVPPLDDAELRSIAASVSRYSPAEAERGFFESPKQSSQPSSKAIVYTRADNVPVQPIRWMWPGRIARGKVSLIAGHPGLGKSQLTASLAAVVTTGGRWPVDRTTCEPGNVLILSAEDDAADTIAPRLKAAGADLSRVYIVEAVVEGYTADGAEARRMFNLGEDLKRLGIMLKDIGGASLVVIDPVSAYLGGADSHRNAEVRALLAPLGELAAAHGAAVVAVSHLNKGSGTEAIGRVTGSMAFVAAARAAFIVAKDPANEARRLFLPMKNNIGNDATGLAFTVEGHEFQSDAGLIQTSRIVWDRAIVSVTADEALRAPVDPEERSALDDAKLFLTGLLADGPVPQKQVRADAEGAGYSWRTIQRAQQSLGIDARKERGNLHGVWLWAMPSKGEER